MLKASGRFEPLIALPFDPVPGAREFRRSKEIVRANDGPNPTAAGVVGSFPAAQPDEPTRRTSRAARIEPYRRINRGTCIARAALTDPEDILCRLRAPRIARAPPCHAAPGGSRRIPYATFFVLAAVAALAAYAPSVRAGEDSGDTEEHRQGSKTEFTPVPIVGGSSDIGFGGGLVVSLARVEPQSKPYLYRVELATTTTVKSELGNLKIPYQDDYVLLSLPHAVRNRLKLELRAAFTHEATEKYYGIGNAVMVPENRSLDDPFYEYERTHVTLSADGTLRVAGPIWLLLWISYVQTWLDVPPNTKLAEDAVAGSPTVRSLVTTFAPQGVVTFSYGVAFDTRDDEVAPVSGQYHTARVDLSPGGAPGVPQRWGRFDVNFRWYVPMGKDGSSVGFHLVSDLLFGDPPFYELFRFDDMGAFGGPSGVRGVPVQRYGGMIKLIGNVEVRKMLFPFHFLSKENHFGVAAFVDTGRAFTTYSSHPELDGTSLGLKLGLGAGARVLAGQSFVLRADVAWSPDARPLGVYVAAGRTF